MKICHVFNMANDGWAAVKGLRAIGCDADLILHRPAHVASLPQWEEAEIDLKKLGSDLQNPNWDALNENWTMPDYVHVWDLRRSWYPFSQLLKWTRHILELSQYDVVVGHIPFAKIAPLYRLLIHKPYTVYDAGWIRDLHSYDFHSYRWARAGYRGAAKIFFTNVDTYAMFIKNGYLPERLVYTPFAIDTELYKPLGVPNEYDKSPIFFSPSRQNWPEKGNDMLLYAFQRYLKRQPNALLLLVEWGQTPEFSEGDYVTKAKRLIKELGIQDNVEWLPVMPKRRLIQHYNLADVVFDQYVFGALGTTAPEAMSCEKPVVAYADPEAWKKWHGSIPPLLNARKADEILNRMIEMEDATLRREIGRNGRLWVSQTCDMKIVAKLQLKVCEQLVERNV